MSKGEIKQHIRSCNKEELQELIESCQAKAAINQRIVAIAKLQMKVLVAKEAKENSNAGKDMSSANPDIIIIDNHQPSNNSYAGDADI